MYFEEITNIVYLPYHTRMLRYFCKPKNTDIHRIFLYHGEFSSSTSQ